MQSLSALRNLAAKKDLPPEIREELELLITSTTPTNIGAGLPTRLYCVAYS